VGRDADHRGPRMPRSALVHSPRHCDSNPKGTTRRSGASGSLPPVGGRASTRTVGGPRSRSPTALEIWQEQDGGIDAVSQPARTQIGSSNPASSIREVAVEVGAVDLQAREHGVIVWSCGAACSGLRRANGSFTPKPPCLPAEHTEVSGQPGVIGVSPTACFALQSTLRSLSS
jgi:hypothetical protein